MNRINQNVKYILRPWAESPITQNRVIPPIYDIDAIILRNAGTATVNLWNGAYTLAPGETVSFNVTTLESTIDFADCNVSFDTSTGANQKLQILTLKSSPCT